MEWLKTLALDPRAFISQQPWEAWGIIALQVLLIFLAARLLVWLGSLGIIRLFNSLAGKSLFLEPRLLAMLKTAVQTIFSYGVYLLALIIVAQYFWDRVISPDDLKGIGSAAFKIAVILLGAGMLVRFGTGSIENLFAEEKGKAGWQENRRLQTLKTLLRSVWMYGVYFLAGLMVLETAGVRTSSLVASAGLASLAIGFGAQNLVRDVITGFFIIFEDHFTIGDFITTAGVTGTVEDLGLRTTRIREWTGQLHIIPNGEITKVTNFSRGRMVAVVTVSVSYEADIDQAMEILRVACQEAKRELPAIVEDPVVHGIIEMGDAGLTVRIAARTLAGEQWAVERELRKRFKKALDAVGLGVAYPRHVVMHQGGKVVREVALPARGAKEDRIDA
ncbi:MAG: mechanosensitive ion channel family protein [Bacillota bacterium]